MNLKKQLATFVAALICAAAAATVCAQDVDAAPAVVIRTVPEAGTKNVAAGETEIKVTFSKPMTDESWSWGTAWEGSVPEIIGKPKFSPDLKTCSVKVKLESGKTYGFWLNSEKFKNFKDAQGKSALPYLLVFGVK